MRKRATLHLDDVVRFGKAASFCGIVVLTLLFCSVAAATEPNKKILILSSEDPYLPAIDQLNQAIRKTFKSGIPGGVTFYYEALEDSRIPGDKYETELVSLLKRKYEGQQFDLSFAFGAPALKFLLKHKGELFSHTPIFFAVQDESRVAGLDLGSDATGVWGKLELTPTLDIALALQPETRRVVVVSGSAPLNKALLAKAQQDFRSYEGKVEFTYLTDLTIRGFQKELVSLPPRTIVFYLGILSDSAGNSYNSPEALSLLTPSSSAPIYATQQAALGTGMVGGSLINYEMIGARAGELGLRILAGTKPRDIPPQTVPSVTTFDWRQLRRWGISEQRLPPGSIIQFRQPSVWELYKWRIVGVSSLCILETLLIVGLLINRTRRRQAEEENKRLARVAEAERQRLDEVVSNVPGIVWETRLEADHKTRKASFVSGYVEQMLGYSVEEWLSTPNFALAIMPDEDRERVVRETEAIFENGNAGFLRFRWMAKDGSLHWVEAQVTAICDATGKTVGLRGVTMDVTERRLAEELLRESDERLKQAISVARFGVFEHDHLTGILHSSPLTREIHAWGEDDTSSLEGLVAQLHTEDRETFIEALRCAHDPAGDGFFSREYRIVLDGGKVRWVSARAQTSFEGENGARRPVRTVGAELDITERKEAEEALRTSAEEVSRLKNQLQAENIYLQEEIKLAHHVDEIVGQSNAIKYVLFKIEQVAETDTTVLILGETGTGKELVARAIHNQSSRKDRPLVKVNCAALSASLIESELFGHEKGAFTGAFARKIGRFELANGATLFLDEIGELPLELQAKLLRVIQEGEFERLGSSKTVKVEVRIIAATNRNMKAEIERGSFREDLWYRLNVFPITVPPLRQRKEDIPLMVEHFVNGFSKKLGKPIKSISAPTLKKLQDYSWPGNVRELANVLERAVINAQGPVLHIADQFEQLQSEELSSSIKTLEEMEKEYIISILDDTAWRIEGPNGAARILGLNPSTLRTRMIKLGIQKIIRSFAGSSGK